jgi:hypothetical protein
MGEEVVRLHFGHFWRLCDVCFFRVLAMSRKKCQLKKCQYSTLLIRKLLAKLSCEHPPPTMASANYQSGTPSLLTMPFHDRNNSKWSWLIVVCLGAGWGHQGGREDGGHHG